MRDFRRIARIAAVMLPLCGGAASAQTEPADAGASLSGATLAEVQARGRLACGVNAGLPGFASVDANNTWTGFEVEFCRALAAAVLGDPSLVDIMALPVADRLASLTTGAVDVVARSAAWSLSPDAGMGIDLAGVSYYDQLGFLVPVEMGVNSPKELGMATICLVGDMTTTAMLDDYFRANGIGYQPMVAASDAEARQMYLSQACDTYARPASELAAVRATFETPGNHLIVTDPASRVPSGPVVRQGDDGWTDIVRWTLHALLGAEELGISSANVREMADAPAQNPEINRLLGTEGSFGALLGLGDGWAVEAVAAGGNYGEIFERHIGENTPIGVARGLNALWTRGGLQYAPPFR